MKILHHFDDDGKGAAAIVYRELKNPFETITPDDFIQYNHSGVLFTPAVKPNERVFIVDLAMDDVILSCIKDMISMGAKVIHIDHHKSGIDYWESVKDTVNFGSNYKNFFVEGLSGCMLTYIYSFMNDEERMNPSDVEYDFTEHFEYLAINPGKRTMREIRIPSAIRYIDDNDVWRHEIPETKYFNAGFKTAKANKETYRKFVEFNNPMEHGEILGDYNKRIIEIIDKTYDENIASKYGKHPLSNIWDEIFYNSTDMGVVKYIDAGRIIFEYETNTYNVGLKNSFQSEFKINTSELSGSYKFLCLNVALGNSRVFCDEFDKYDGVCKFSYDGTSWVYTMYSKEDGCNVGKLVTILGKKYNAASAGGHPHAAGMHLDILILSKDCVIDINE